MTGPPPFPTLGEDFKRRQMSAHPIRCSEARKCHFGSGTPLGPLCSPLKSQQQGRQKADEDSGTPCPSNLMQLQIQKKKKKKNRRQVGSSTQGQQLDLLQGARGLLEKRNAMIVSFAQISVCLQVPLGASGCLLLRTGGWVSWDPLL